MTKVLTDNASRIINNNDVISDFIFPFLLVSVKMILVKLVNNEGHNNYLLQLNLDNYVYK